MTASCPPPGLLAVVTHDSRWFGRRQQPRERCS
jgi:hypothetical protein